MKKILCLLCLFGILACGTVSTMAMINGSHMESITINTDTGVAVCYAHLEKRSGSSVRVVCSLQKNTGAAWVTLATWIGTGKDQATISQVWPVDAGYTYRLNITYEIYDSSGNIIEEYLHTVSKHYPRDFEYNALAEEHIS